MPEFVICDFLTFFEKITTIKFKLAKSRTPEPETNGQQTKFLYWAKLVFRVTRLQLPAGLVIPVNQVIS